ncbi:uncharacterized protein L3040_008764 [Drepanopeziza brunnea f. sp. 'multigermtubi']|nr:hypothetical protein L3040_008764 [Drepanopeziza brunnea f. sp. 'multigermtubi']
MFASNSLPHDGSSRLRLSHEKVSVNGNNRSSFASAKSSVADGPEGYFDGGRGQTNGDTLRDGLLNSLPNGRASVSTWDQRSSRNGSTLSVNGAGTNGSTEMGGRRSPAAHQNGVVRTSYADRSSIASIGNGPNTMDTKTSSNGNSETAKRTTISPPTPTSMPPPIPTGIPPPIPTTPPPPIPTHTNGTGSPQVPEAPTRAPPPPHRMSSPPSYPPPLVPSSSTNSLPHAQLQQRHTLQVPKPGPSRNSRDADDAVFASGRFSPTNIAAGVRRGSVSLNRRHAQSVHSNMPHEEVPPDEDAMLWAEAVRQKRASKRRRKDEEDDDRVVVGTKVDQNHVNWVTAYNMLTGIRFTVSRTNAKLDRPLTDADFEARHKFSFDITGNELTPSAKYDFKFKDYAPWVFRHLRGKFKLDPADYLMSLTSKYILSELGSPGKSGSFFYFSRDYKYIIKTIHHAEHKFLRKILKDYYAHVEENPNTLLSQFYGLHRVKMPYGRKIHFVVMNNLFPPHRDIHKTFDLKGSTIGRDFKEEDLEKNPRATLKDLNWLRRNLHLEFGPEKKRLFFEQMEKDVHLLQKLKIMDYSMLVGIHDLQRGNQDNLRDKTLQVFQPGGETQAEEAQPPGALMRTPSKLENMRKARELRQIIKQEKPIPMGQSSSRMPDHLEENTAKREFTFYSDDGGFRATHEDNSPGEEIFFLSIIDCLTHYGTVKKLEHFFKGLSQDKKLISPISPEPYGNRFIEFIEGVTKSPEEAAREAAAAPPPHTTSTLSDNRNTTSIDSAGRRSENQTMYRSSHTNATVMRNENDAMRRDRHSDDDGPSPDSRVITTARSPSADRSSGLQGQILPVVEERGETSSTGGRSGGSREREESANLDPRPPTPPKAHNDGRPITPAKDYSPTRNSAIRTSVNRSSLDKQLPPLPKVLGPGEIRKKDSMLS